MEIGGFRGLINIFKKDCSMKSFSIIFAFSIIPMTVIVWATFNMSNIYNMFVPFNDWFQANPISGFFVFAGLYLICVPLAIPSTILTLAGGTIFSLAFGKVKGYFLCLMAIFLGHPPAAMIAFAIGRYLLKSFI